MAPPPEVLSTMVMLVIYAVVAVGISFVCSVLEAVLLSITPSYVAMQQNQQSAFAKRLLAYKRDVDRPLAAILTLNTFAHTIGAAGVGAEAAQIWGSQVLGVVSAVMTVIILLASEIVPKTIGAVYWRALAHPTVAVLRVLIVLLWPIIILCAGITRLLRKGGDQPVLKRGDFRNLADAGHRFGVLRGDERIIISNLLNFEGLSVRDVMTPRDQLVVLPEDATVRAVGPSGPGWWTTRILIYHDDIDSINGYVLKEDVLEARLQGRDDLLVGALRRPLLTIAADARLHTCYAMLAGQSAHIALVMDDQDRVAGVITMEDIIETMFGYDIDDEDEPDTDPEIGRRPAGRETLRRSGAIPAAAPHQARVETADDPAVEVHPADSEEGTPRA